MSAAAAAFRRPKDSAYKDADGDNEHIDDSAFDDGLPSFATEFGSDSKDDEAADSIMPSVVAYLTAVVNPVIPGYAVNEHLSVAYQVTELRAAPDTALQPRGHEASARQGGPLLTMRLRDCSEREPPEDTTRVRMRPAFATLCKLAARLTLYGANRCDELAWTRSTFSQLCQVWIALQ